MNTFPKLNKESNLDATSLSGRAVVLLGAAFKLSAGDAIKGIAIINDADIFDAPIISDDDKNKITQVIVGLNCGGFGAEAQSLFNAGWSNSELATPEAMIQATLTTTE